MTCLINSKLISLYYRLMCGRFKTLYAEVAEIQREHLVRVLLFDMSSNLRMQCMYSIPRIQRALHISRGHGTRVVQQGDRASG